MILLQAFMNPLGIALGWSVSGSGPLIVGIFESISAGTFLYIATVEVIVEEFAIAKYKVTKFLLYLVAIGFVSSIWYIEQATGGD
jgi:solute carrier family 39 (zinc transporter), member 1/2/3